MVADVAVMKEVGVRFVGMAGVMKSISEGVFRLEDPGVAQPDLLEGVVAGRDTFFSPPDFLRLTMRSSSLTWTTCMKSTSPEHTETHKESSRDAQGSTQESEQHTKRPTPQPAHTHTATRARRTHKVIPAHGFVDVDAEKGAIIGRRRCLPLHRHCPRLALCATPQARALKTGANSGAH